MAEQKNIRKKDIREFNYEKHKREQDKKRRQLQRRAARNKRNEPNICPLEQVTNSTPTG